MLFRFPDIIGHRIAQLQVCTANCPAPSSPQRCFHMLAAPLVQCSLQHAMQPLALGSGVSVT